MYINEPWHVIKCTVRICPGKKVRKVRGGRNLPDGRPIHYSNIIIPSYRNSMIQIGGKFPTQWHNICTVTHGKFGTALVSMCSTVVTRTTYRNSRTENTAYLHISQNLK